MTPSITHTAPAQKAPAPQAAGKPQAGSKQEFAQMLSEQQAVADDGGTCLPATAQAATNHAQGREKTAAKGERSESKKSAKTDQAGQVDDAEAQSKTDDAAAAEETPADLLQALQLNAPPDAVKPDAGKGEAREADAEEGVQGLLGKSAKASRPGVAGDALGKGALALQSRGDDQTDVRGARGDAGQLDGSKAKTADAKADAAWQAVAERAAITEPSARRELPTVNAAGQLEHMAQPLRTAEASASTQASIAAPANSAEFPQALGVEISVLARDGVQHAELQLNPAEMGPISVRIALDGAQARVEFGAEVAATRQIIENSLPELASAMRDAGFTLSGGGVHSQARGRDENASGQPRGGQGGSPNAALVDANDPAARRVNARVSAGGVDLYA